MDQCRSGMAEAIAKTVSAFEHDRTGAAPESITVILGGDTLVVAIRGALSRAEQALAQRPDGAAQVQEFHRQLFATTAGQLCTDIERITGVRVREAATEAVADVGTILKVFTSGTIVQVFLLADRVATDFWTEDSPRGGDSDDH